MVNKSAKKEIVLTGLGGSPGIGIGVSHVSEAGSIPVPEYQVPTDQVGGELERFTAAAAQARRQIRRLRTKAKRVEGAERDLDDLLDAYIQMLKDSRLVRGVRRRIKEEQINSEAAVQEEFAQIAEQFSAMDDAYIRARIEDIRAVAKRLVRNLSNKPFRQFSRLKKGSVLVAEELSPADTAQLNPENVVGFATVLGGAEGHTAIMARALGLPAVLGAPDLLKRLRSGVPTIIDGYQGRIIVHPTDETVARYRALKAEKYRGYRKLAQLKRQSARTRDGTDIVLQANMELPFQINSINAMGAAGIGLLRSEFLFMNRENIPSEEEQYQVLQTIVGAMEGKVVTVRTLDVGGEKTLAALMGDYAESASSALGLRGIRLSLVRDDLLETQFRAILRASAYGPVRILLPMVTAVQEVRQARAILARAARKLKRRKIPFANPLPPLGAMIEVPAAALLADALAHACDFFAIGSNDLTMYTMAIDRSNEQVAHLYDPLSPAVLRLVQFSVKSALRAGIPVSVCGEIAGGPRYTALLLGLGIRELSMTAPNIPHVKERIRSLDISAADRRASIIMNQNDTGRIATLLDDFNALA